MRVVVVGAGMAGLAAAARLEAGGCTVEVVEAGSRLGGRARTVRNRFVGEQYVESGAEWVDTHHHRMTELLARHGMRLQGAGQTWTAVRRLFYRNGVLAHTADVLHRVAEELDSMEAALDTYTRLVPDPGRPHAVAEAAALDQRTFAELADECGLGEVARLYHRRNSEGEFAEEPEGVSLLFVVQQRAQARDAARAVDAPGPITAHRIEGGLDRLVAAMASDLSSPPRLGEPVQAVIERPGHVEVVTAARTVSADAVVLTCALPALRAIRLDADVDPVLLDAIAELGYGTVTKTAVQFAGRQWAAGYATTDTVSQRIYEPTVDQPGEHGVLMAYTGGDGGRQVAALEDAARLDTIEADIRAVHGIDAPRVGGFSRAWSTEPRFGGSYAVYRPGQVTAFWDVLRRPHGRVHLAGEHAATWTGYLEGAVESGQMVAERLLLA
jgi:monoamine oxidase